MEESSKNKTQKGFITPLSNCENIDPNNDMETTCEDSVGNLNKNALNMVNVKHNFTVDINLSDTCVSSSGETSSVYDSTMKNILTRKKLMVKNIQDKKYSIGINLDDTTLTSDSDSFQTNAFPKAIIFNCNNISLNKSMELSLNNSVDINIPNVNSDTPAKTEERPQPSAMVLEMQKELNTVSNTQDIDKQTYNLHNGPVNLHLHNSDNASTNTVSDSREMELTHLLCKSTPPQNYANQEFETVGSLEMDLTYVKVLKAKNMSSQMDIDSFENNTNQGSEAVSGSLIMETKEQENCFEKNEDKKILDEKPNTQKESIENAKKSESPNKPEIELQSRFQNPCTGAVFDTHEIKITQGLQKSAIPVLKNKQISELHEEKSFHSPNPCATTVSDTQEMEITQELQKSAIPVLKNKPMSELHNEEKSFLSPNPCAATVSDTQEMEITQDLQKSAIPVVKNKQMSELHNEQKSFHSANPCATTVFDTQEMETTETFPKDFSSQNNHIPASEVDSQKINLEHINNESTEEAKNKRKIDANEETEKIEINEPLQKKNCGGNSHTETVFETQMEIAEVFQKDVSSQNNGTSTLEVDSQTENKDEKSTQKAKNECNSEANTEKIEIKEPSQTNIQDGNPCTETVVFGTQEMGITEALKNVASIQKADIGTAIVSETQVAEDDKLSKNPDQTFDSTLESPKNIKKLLSSNLKRKKISVQIDFNNSKSTSDTSLNDSDINPKAKIFHAIPPKKSTFSELATLDETENKNLQTSDQLTIPEIPISRFSRANKSEYTICLSLDSLSDSNNSNLSVPNLESEVILMHRCIEPNDFKLKSKESVIKPVAETSKILPEIASECDNKNTTFEKATSIAEPGSETSKKQDQANTSVPETQPILSQKYTEQNNADTDSIQSQASTIIPENADCDENKSNETINTSLTEQFRSEIIDKKPIISEININECPDLIVNNNMHQLSVENLKNLPENDELGPIDVNNISFENQLLSTSEMIAENANINSLKIELPVKSANEAAQDLIKNTELSQTNINDISNTQGITENKSKNQLLSTSELRRSRRSLGKNVSTENANANSSKIDLPMTESANEAAQGLVKNTDISQPNVNDITQDISIKKSKNQLLSTSELRRSRRSIGKNVSTENANANSSQIELPMTKSANEASQDLVKNTDISQPNVNDITQDISVNKSKNQLLSTSELRRSKRSIGKNVSTENANANSSKIELPMTKLANEASQELVKNTDISQPNVNDITQDISVNKSKNQLLSTIELRRSKRSAVKNSSVNSSKIELLTNEVTQDLINNTDISQPNDITKNSSSSLRRTRRNTAKNISVSMSLVENAAISSIKNPETILPTKEVTQDLKITTAETTLPIIVSETPQDLPDGVIESNKKINTSERSLQSSKNLSESQPRRKGFLKSISEKSNDSSKFNFTKPQLPIIDLSKGKSMEHTRKKRITFRPSDENSIINYPSQSSQSSKNSTENNLKLVKSKVSEKKITDLSNDTSLELSVIPQEHQRKKRLIFHSTPVRTRYSDSQNLNSKSEPSSFGTFQEEEIIEQDEIQEAMDVELSVISEENVEVELNESASSLQSEVVSLPNVSKNNSTLLLTTYDMETDDDDDSNSITSVESLKSLCSSKKDESLLFPFRQKKVRKERQSEKLKKLFKPVKWMNAKFYNYLENKLKPKYQLRARKVSEEFAIFLFNTYSLVINGHNKESDISELKMKMKELNLCTNNIEFFMYIYDFMPFHFRRLAIPLGGAYGTSVGPRVSLYDPL